MGHVCEDYHTDVRDKQGRGTHQEIQDIHTRKKDIRWKADHRDEPGVLYRGQPIVGYREWMEGDVYSGALWRGVLVLADGTWLELEEKRR